ncbi:hypothetical protein [Marinilabilia salmonicolor]|uniref:Uncharacterized protein n=1 Tax=Marinilabilia salmonicolor TaxID=989 RepID=A0A368UIZ5_9BACT|nr:hypothetical protein [Marinilabilia salmonicolor]RCW24663.1 hypothetical protein DFO77_1459 [Marinilabilia salmonicolor]
MAYCAFNKNIPDEVPLIVGQGKYTVYENPIDGGSGYVLLFSKENTKVTNKKTVKNISQENANNDFQIINNKQKKTTQIKIKLDPSKITDPEFGDLLLSDKYSQLLSKKWTIGHFKLDDDKQTFLLVRADKHIHKLKNVEMELVYSFYKMPSGGVFGMFLNVFSNELSKVSPHGFPVFEFLTGLDYSETEEFIKNFLKQDILHICFADKSNTAYYKDISGQSKNYSIPKCQFELKHSLDIKLKKTILEKFEDLLNYHKKTGGNFNQCMHELDTYFPISESPILKSKEQTIEVSLFNKHTKIPHILFGIVWSIFSVWLCVRENQYGWLILLLFLGFLPYLCEVVLFREKQVTK